VRVEHFYGGTIIADFDNVVRPKGVKLVPSSLKSKTVLSLVLLLVLVVSPCTALSADDEEYSTSISLRNEGLPANDLLYQDGGKSEVLTPARAGKLKKQNTVDLSLLEPDPSDIYKGQSTANDSVIDQSIQISEGEVVRYMGPITSTSRRFRFNVQTQEGAKTLTIMMSKNLHGVLLRKELLRRLGYKIPAMKYLKQVRIRFPDLVSTTYFLKNQIPLATEGASSRWQVPSEPGADPLVVVLQDVLVTEATPLYYNLALLAPDETIPGTNDLRPEGARVLRALAVIYGLVDVEESLNQVSWAVGKLDNNAITLTNLDGANFNCTLDDALWILRRISKLNREDFKQITLDSFYPLPVAGLLMEKLIARRNSILKDFSLKIPDISFDAHFTALPSVKNGKVIQKEWPGYASRFAWGDPESPLRGLSWYGLSVAESNVMENILESINRKLPSVTVNDQNQKHQKELFEQATKHFTETGEMQNVKIGVWAAPIASGSVDVSRNIVIGNYLGTSNLVQVADNCSVNINVGLTIGVDGITVVGFQGLVQGTASLNYTYLRPLSSFKQAVKDPIKKELVPLLFHKASKLFKSASDLGSSDQKDVKDALAEDLTKLKEFIGVGESLIMTERLTGVQSLTLSAHYSPAMVGANVTGGVNEIVLGRIHIFRQDINHFVVFKDDGELAGVNVSLQASEGGPVYFPVLNISAHKVNGSARSEIFKVDVTPNPKANPSVFAAANALAVVLKTGSIELLEALQKPYKISSAFRDMASSLSFFHYMHRSLKTNAQIDVQLPSGDKGSFLSLSQGSQSGLHYQSLATQAASFLTEKWTGDTSLNVDTQAAANPGQSFLGHSQTKNAVLEARVDRGLSNLYIRVQNRWEGWNIKTNEVMSLIEEENKKYSFEFYPHDVLLDTKAIKLYTISFDLNIYEQGIRNLMSLSPIQVESFLSKYSAIHECEKYPLQIRQMKVQDMWPCSTLLEFKNAFKSYQKGEKDVRRAATLILEAVTRAEEIADFRDFVVLVGGSHNIYLSSTIKGYHIGSEKLSEPIYSNAYGTPDEFSPSGVLDVIEKILGIADGEFKMQWLRDVL